MSARNTQAALACIGEAMSACAAPRVSLREIVARCRMRDQHELAPFTDAEVRELFELTNIGALLPDGPAGEAAMSYLLAQRRGTNPIPAAFRRLQALGGRRDDIDALSEWLRDLAARHLATAAQLETEIRGAGA